MSVQLQSDINGENPYIIEHIIILLLGEFDESYRTFWNVGERQELYEKTCRKHDITFNEVISMGEMLRDHVKVNK